MVPDDMGRILVAMIVPPGFTHPLALDVLLGTLYGIVIGLALSAVRSGSR